MSFRPYPLLSLLSALALAALLMLGFWQVDRAGWKAEQIAVYDRAANGPALDLRAGLCEGEASLGRAVSIEAPQTPDPVIRFYGRGPEGAPGWRVFAPIALEDCGPTFTVLAEVRFEPLETVAHGADGARYEPTPVLSQRFELPQAASVFTPANDPEAGAFYAFDAGAMETALGLSSGVLRTDYWLARNDGALPAHLAQTPPERHIGYAVTWFLMALALVGVYVAFHMRSGRLKLRP